MTNDILPNPPPPDTASNIQKFLDKGDVTGWFDDLYARADGDATNVPWACMEPRPALVNWLARNPQEGAGKRALVIACGLGDDAEALAALGFNVTAFDIAPTAIDWCNKRFPDSSVDYLVADMFDPPAEWIGAFDFVLEIFTVQALPIKIRPKAATAVSQFVAPNGTLLVITIGLEAEDRQGPPWPLTSAELKLFEQDGLAQTYLSERPIRPDANRVMWRVAFRRNGVEQ